MIRVDENYIIVVTATQYIVKRNTHNKNAVSSLPDLTLYEDIYRVVGSYDSLTSAIKGIIDD